MLYFNNNPLSALNFGGNRVAQVNYKSSPSASAITVWKAKRTITSARSSYALSSSLSESPFYTQTGMSATTIDAITFNGISVVVRCNEDYNRVYLAYSTNGISWSQVVNESSGHWVSKLMLINNTLYFFYVISTIVDSGTKYRLYVCKSTDGITWTDTATNILESSDALYFCQLVYINGQFHFLYHLEWDSVSPNYQVKGFIKAYTSSDGVNWVLSEFNDANCIQHAPDVTSPHFYVVMMQLFSPTGDGNWYALMRNRIYPYPVSTSDAYDLYYIIKSNDLINWTYDSDFDVPEGASSAGILGLIGSAESPVYLTYVLNGATAVIDMRTKTVASVPFIPAGTYGKSYEYASYLGDYRSSSTSLPKLFTDRDIFILSVYTDDAYTHYYSDSLTASVWNVINAVPDASKPLLMVRRDK